MKIIQNVMVTGGNGLIGRRVCFYLTQCGYKVISVDRTNLLNNMNPIPGVTVIEGDLRDINFVNDIITGIDIIVHLAAGVSFLMYEEQPIEETLNVFQSFVNLIESCKQQNVKKFIFASTSAVYEGNSVPYNEHMRLDPPDQKAFAKKACEELGVLYQKRYGIQFYSIRPFSVYGEEEWQKGGYANIISLFTWTMLAGKRPLVWGDGNQRRDFIYVDDVAKIFVKYVTSDIINPVINAGTGIETSFNEVIDIINNELETNIIPEYIPIGVDIYATRLQANTNIQEEQNLIHDTSVVQGIRRIIASARKLDSSMQENLSKAQTEYQYLWYNKTSV